ncbi:MAG: hypothetical protein O3A25_03540 [Acidobacteria bacterium]|nr:hypothetical protein [Acidobacteriota bacterium]
MSTMSVGRVTVAVMSVAAAVAMTTPAAAGQGGTFDPPGRHGATLI